MSTSLRLNIMGCCYLKVVVALACVYHVASVAIPVDINVVGGDTFVGLLSSSSAFTLNSNQYELFYPTDATEQIGCSPVSALAGTSANKAIILLRGGCTFEEKVLRGQAAGADLVIIVNSEIRLANETSGLLFDPCAVDCELGSSSTDADACAASSTCLSDYCLPNAVVEAQVPTQQFCCVADDTVQNLFYENATIDVGAIHVGIAAGAQLITAAATNPSITLSESSSIGFSPAAVALLLIGTFVTAGASYRATRAERYEVCKAWGQTPPEPKEKEIKSVVAAPASSQAASGEGEKALANQELETVELTLTMGLVFLVISSASLVGMFFLFMSYPTEGVIAVIVLYSLGSIFATSYFILQPILRLVFPKSIMGWKFPLGRRMQECLEEEYLQVDALVGIVISLTLVIVWFVFRHEDWAWVLQNIFSTALACIFLVTVRISSLKVNMAILFGFFVYDIFMVFITPFFGGGSIMVEVATAGAGSSEASSDMLTCLREEDERLPMLFLFPREGGYGLLGLGDIILPGIFVVYVLRADYIRTSVFNFPDTSKISPRQWVRSHAYFLPVCFAYFVSLGGAFVVNLLGIRINGVAGQPALLYIVPAVVGMFVVLAKCRGELSLYWKHSLIEIDERAIRRQGVRDEEQQQSVEVAEQ